MRGYRHRAKKQPVHRKVKLSDPTPGHCRFCNLPILSPMGAILTRKTWHPHCVTAYKEQAHPQELRKAIFARDKGICADCGYADPNWEADHIKPLKLGGAFTHDNVQTLCRGCHKAKSKTDVYEIRQAGKAEASPNLDTK
jgi:5-methylcytosine-specific restriction endonuclease McrA